jgi:hypothetical protein
VKYEIKDNYLGDSVYEHRTWSMKTFFWKLDTLSLGIPFSLSLSLSLLFLCLSGLLYCYSLELDLIAAF